ncbi:MAG: tRNA (adenosine(37)-N6)-threonylcarbamoyltransferase complex ATPase subunit type 1 TsaE [Proteobacteria bacterium]|nr:tRNA (adenosine(37)-N6)-threonylcarbamoyltransferase complex ATPase subunit type 1 TsaE [Pseudomonadota bacterium]
MSETRIEWRVDLPEEAATLRMAQKIAAELRPGDLVTLSGELGAGKTTFARAIIRALTRDPGLEVPSPTYTLLQTYDAADFRIVHADLYRVADIAELVELGWEDAAENAIVLVEWAEKAGEALAEDRLEVRLDMSPEDGRHLRLTGHGRLAPRLQRAMAIENLFEKAGFVDPRRDPMQGDASTRAYERVHSQQDGRKAILMIAPRRADGPPIRLGKSYSALAHLAESVHAFVAMAKALREQGYSAPVIHAADLDAGLLLVEDLGSGSMTDENGPIAERYALAVDLLAELHGRNLPTELPVDGILTHKLHRYDLEALTIETELLLDWYFPAFAKKTPNAGTRLSFVDGWVNALQAVLEGERTWTLRDYFSANFVWLPEREGLARVGLLDFQDCVIGHPAYDLVSLLQDARLDVPEALELQMLARYARARRARDPDFDMQAFTTAYAILGAQRASKILGIFVRLDRRDGKPAYLAYLPRVEGCLRRCLAHPALAKLKTWYDTHLPGFASAPTEPENDASEHPQGAAEESDGAGGGLRQAHEAAD